jgi:hypothetical protein
MKVELKRKERIIYCCVVVVLKKEEKKIDKTFVRVLYKYYQTRGDFKCSSACWGVIFRSS